MTPEEAVQAVSRGNLATCTREEYPEIRRALQSYAAKQVDGGQAVYAQIALNEVKRLDRVHEFTFGALRRGGVRVKAKVFRLNDYDWWAGFDLESVKEAYVKETGVPREEAFEDPQEVPDEAMDKLLHYGSEDYPHGTPKTFREELQAMIDQGVEFPFPFASSEC